MIRLVINADDLGLHPRLDEGIFRAHAQGVLTSASLLVTGRNAADAVRRAKTEGLALGLHFCLTTHLAPASSLHEVRWLAPGGRFRKDWAELSLAWLSRLIPREEVEQELRAQFKRARELGASIDHLDTHQHLHLLPGLTDVVEGFAHEHHLPVRWPVERPHARWLRHPATALKTAALTTLGRFKRERGVRRIPAVGIFESGELNERRLLRLVERLDDGAWEIITHPGLAPGTVKEDPSWRYGWEDELAALTSPRVRSSLERKGVKLVSYAELS